MPIYKTGYMRMQQAVHSVSQHCLYRNVVIVAYESVRTGGIGAGIRRSIRPRGKRSGVNFKEEVKQLMFPISGPVCVSKDGHVFQDVMMVFYHYEETVSYQSKCNYIRKFN